MEDHSRIAVILSICLPLLIGSACFILIGYLTIQHNNHHREELAALRRAERYRRLQSSSDGYQTFYTTRRVSLPPRPSQGPPGRVEIVLPNRAEQWSEIKVRHGPQLSPEDISPTNMGGPRGNDDDIYAGPSDYQERQRRAVHLVDNAQRPQRPPRSRTRSSSVPVRWRRQSAKDSPLQRQLLEEYQERSGRDTQERRASDPDVHFAPTPGLHTPEEGSQDKSNSDKSASDGGCYGVAGSPKSSKSDSTDRAVKSSTSSSY